MLLNGRDAETKGEKVEKKKKDEPTVRNADQQKTCHRTRRNISVLH